MTKIKVKIINGFRKTSGFGWRFVPKWKQEFIKLNGMNRFELLLKGKNIQNSIGRNLIIDDLKSKLLTVPNPEKFPDIFKFHNGLDFVSRFYDNKLLAIADGIIIRSNYDDLSGNYIKIQHTLDGVKYILSYCHLKNLVELKKGDVINVKKGEWIGVMGNSGTTSTGVHCHLTVKKYLTNEIIDPETIFEFI
jgi:murein DD-endopeptidase MepM/ murein hydrolase activator NlpD